MSRCMKLLPVLIFRLITKEKKKMFLVQTQPLNEMMSVSGQMFPTLAAILSFVVGCLRGCRIFPGNDSDNFS